MRNIFISEEILHSTPLVNQPLSFSNRRCANGIFSNYAAMSSFFPEHAIETGVECAVDPEERVEVVVTEFAAGISDVVCDNHEELKWELGGRHRDRIGVERNASRSTK
jgi:hypothetical protein